MKRTLGILCSVIFALSCLACAKIAPTDNAVQTLPPDSQTAGQDETPEAETADELNAQIRQYTDDGDYENAYLAARRLMELEPDNADAYLLATGALLALNEQNEQEMKELIAEALTNAPDSAQQVGDWLKENGLEGTIEMPFTPDYSDANEINAVGNTPGNMTNALRDGYWRGGFATTQAGWIYFSRFTDDKGAIYKMRTDGSELQRIGDAHGYSLNVVGDWLYFIDPYDNDYAYRMRTDGTNLEKITDFSCSFLTVAGEWAFCDGFGEEGTLCKFRTDGTEQTALTDFTVIDCCAYGDWVYFYRKSMENGGLLRIRMDGSGMEVVVDQIPVCYTISNDVVYYMNPDDPWSIMQCDLNGGNPKEVYRASDTITAMNAIGDTLIVAFGVSFDENGVTLSKSIVTVDLPSGKTTNEWEVATEPLCVGEGCVFYTNDSEGMRWHCLNLETSEDIPME